MNNMNANMNNAFIRANKKFIYSYSRSANMNMSYIRIPLFLSDPYTYPLLLLLAENQKSIDYRVANELLERS